MAGRTAIGLDIGTSSVRAAQVTVSKGNAVLDRFGQVGLPPGAVRDGEVAALVTRFNTQVAQGWGDTQVELPAGSWHDVFTSRAHGPRVAMSELFADLPVAVLALGEAR